MYLSRGKLKIVIQMTADLSPCAYCRLADHQEVRSGCFILIELSVIGSSSLRKTMVVGSSFRSLNEYSHSSVLTVL